MFYKKQLSEIETVKDLMALSWKDFEYFCKFLLAERGDGIVQVTPKKGAKGGDGGIDLKIQKANEVIYAQCKHWSGRHNGLSRAIRELSGCMTRDGVKKGIFFVSTEASAFEKEEAHKMNIELLDNTAIFRILRRRKNDKVKRKQPLSSIEETAVSMKKAAHEHWLVKVLVIVITLFYSVLLLPFLLLRETLFFILRLIANLFDWVIKRSKNKKLLGSYYKRIKGKKKHLGYRTRSRYKGYYQKRRKNFYATSGWGI